MTVRFRNIPPPSLFKNSKTTQKFLEFCRFSQNFVPETGIPAGIPVVPAGTTSCPRPRPGGKILAPSPFRPRPGAKTCSPSPLRGTPAGKPRGDPRSGKPRHNTSKTHMLKNKNSVNHGIFFLTIPYRGKKIPRNGNILDSVTELKLRFRFRGNKAEIPRKYRGNSVFKISQN